MKIYVRCSSSFPSVHSPDAAGTVRACTIAITQILHTIYDAGCYHIFGNGIKDLGEEGEGLRTRECRWLSYGGDVGWLPRPQLEEWPDAPDPAKQQRQGSVNNSQHTSSIARANI